MHAESVGERTRIEPAATRENDQSPKLRQRHITVDVDKRTCGDRDQDPRRTQHPIDDFADLAAIRPLPRTRSHISTAHGVAGYNSC